MNATIKCIQFYSSVTDLIQECKPELVETLDPEIWDFIDHVFDFEPFSFVLINNETVLVVDSLNGDAIGQEMNLDDYIRQLIEYAQEER